MQTQDRTRQILWASAIVILVAAICYPFTEAMGYRSVALILLLTVSILAMRLELIPVITAAVISALVWDFFFIPPHFTLHIGSAEDVLFIIMYFIVAVLNGMINHRMRQMEALNREKEDREKALNFYNILFSSLSHDLRTPLATVVGATDTLAENEHLLTPAQKKILITDISSAAVRLSEQVDNLLNISRMEAGMIHPKKSWCDINDLFSSVLKKAGDPDSEHPVQVVVPEDFPLVQLDFGLTEQILYNLVQNAMHHTAPGTKVWISAKLIHETNGHFEGDNLEFEALHTVRDKGSNTLLIQVHDNGPGFVEAEMEQLFDKFYRPENTRADGTGLGLYIAKGFTDIQGGEIRVRNLPDGGAAFTIEFDTEIVPQAIQHD